MFSNCNSIISLDLSSFNTQNLTYMGAIFYNCNSLISLDLSNFNTKKVNHMEYMLAHCHSLISLNLSNFVVQNDYFYSHTIYYDCNSLILKYLKKYNAN